MFFAYNFCGRLHNEVELDVQNDRFLGGTPNNPSLTIIEAKRDDNGTYKCQLGHAIVAMGTSNEIKVNVQCKLICFYWL